MVPLLELEFQNSLINLSLSAGALRALLNTAFKTYHTDIYLLRDRWSSPPQFS